MTTHKISTTLNTTVNASKANDTWLVTTNGMVDTMNVGIAAEGPQAGREIIVEGSVYGLNYAITFGAMSGKGGGRISIGKEAFVGSADTGILSRADNQTIVNEGTIGAETGIVSMGKHAHIVNDGLIEVADGGIVIQEGTAKVVNNGTITGEGNIFGPGNGAGRIVVINNGLINGDGKAGIELQSDAGHKIINRGTVEGSVQGGDGRDVFVSDGGSVDGQVNLKDGNDTYFIDSAALQLYEFDNSGKDTVKSSVSYTLEDHFEILTLTGSHKLDGNGNAEANSLFGNGAGNRLNGGAGNDMLHGGGGADTFIFDWLGGKDKITDFDSGTDRIDLTDFASHGIDSFNDIKAAAENKNGDLLITIGTDHILIQDFSKADLDKADFLI